jgi:hypothetical protein
VSKIKEKSDLARARGSQARGSQGLVWALCLLLLAAWLAPGAVGQAGRPGAGARAQKGTGVAAKGGPGAEQQLATQAQGDVRLVPSAKAQALGTAYREGRLPEPARVPEGDADAQAAELARRVAAGDSNSTAALYAAILAAGFGVRDTDGAMLKTVTPGQGLAFDAFEVAAMAKMYGEGRSAPLSDLGLLLASQSPQLDKKRIADLLLEGVRTHAGEGGSPHLRLWARFVVELGRQRGDDLLSAKDSALVRLDSVQHAFITLRLTGDFAARSGRGTTGAGQAASARPVPLGDRRAGLGEMRTEGGARFIKAGFGAGGFEAEGAAQSGPPCKLEGDGGTIMDAAALGISTGFGSLMGYLEGALGDKAKGFIEKYGKFATAVNILLAYAKFVQSYASLETVIEMEGAGPLVRTRNARPGGRKNFVATTRVNIGKWQTYNCIRLALVTAAGIDFSTMNDGPLGGVTVTWHLDSGGDGDAYSNRGGRTGAEQIVGIVNDGPRIQDAGTYAGVGGRAGRAVGNATQTRTDEQGRARVSVEGTPQKNHKMGPVFPVMKRAQISTTVRLKGGDVKGDSVDIISQAMAGLPGLISMPTELIYRSDWASTAAYEFEVKDWEDCTGGWRGTVEISQTLLESDNASKKDPITRVLTVEKRDHIYQYDARISVEPGAERNSLVASANATLSDKTFVYSLTEFDDDCGGPMRRMGNEGRWTRQTRGQGRGEADLSVHETAPGVFNLSFGVSGFTGDWTIRQVGSYKNHCEADCQHEPYDITDKGQESVDAFMKTLEEVAADPSDPNLLRGSRTFDDGGFQVTIKWNLARCR